MNDGRMKRVRGVIGILQEKISWNWLNDDGHILKRANFAWHIYFPGP